MLYFHSTNQKRRSFLNLQRLVLQNICFKMAATDGPSCGEVGLKFSKQELSYFSEVIMKQNLVNTNVLYHTPKNLE